MTVSLHHVVDGPGDAPAVLLAPSLGTTLSLWQEQIPDLASRFRVVRFDTRGHGGSPVPDGPYTLHDLVDDVLALADSLGLATFAYAGISLGGAIGQLLAAEHPDRVDALLLCNTGPSFGDPVDWHERAARVRAEGLGWLIEPTRDRWFPRGFAAAHPDAVEALLEAFAATSPQGYAGCCDALADCHLEPILDQITAPTRVITGAEDPVSGPHTARTLVASIPDADLVVLDDAAHIANVARPDAFTAAVLEHLEKHHEP